MRMTAFCLPFLLASGSALAQPAAFSMHINGIENGKPIAPRFAFCQPDGQGKTKDGGNLNPEISWSGAPEGTKSFALLVVDKDVPESFADANQPGKTLPEDAPRRDFYHWVLVDIPASRSQIAEGEDSRAVNPQGKPVGKTAYGVNGRNDYASFMKGEFGGYDGPCPPWNDARIHRYHFQLYALNVESLGLSGAFDGKNATNALKNYTLAKTEWVGTYSTKR
jgi:Raf kinase inhibitor-like YbhB/YbcL family protein